MKRSSEAPQHPLKSIIRRRSPIAGWGVYAGETITKNSRIVDYAGELISWKESERREARYIKKGCIWCFVLERPNTVVDANIGGNVARFINHSCRPNCYTQVVDGIIWIRASRRLRKGEEITYDYETGGTAGIKCRCRPGCTATL